MEIIIKMQSGEKWKFNNDGGTKEEICKMICGSGFITLDKDFTVVLNTKLIESFEFREVKSGTGR